MAFLGALVFGRCFVFQQTFLIESFAAAAEGAEGVESFINRPSLFDESVRLFEVFDVLARVQYWDGCGSHGHRSKRSCFVCKKYVIIVYCLP